MEIIIEATPVITIVNGARCRVWRGHTADGTQCEVFVTGIAVAEGQDQAEFERALESIPAPAEALVPLSLIAPAQEEG